MGFNYWIAVAELYALCILLLVIITVLLGVGRD